MKPPVLILHAPGSNRDREAAWACEQAGGAPRIATVSSVVSGDLSLKDFSMLVLPGGFSHGDDLGAGRVWALALRTRLAGQVEDFVAAGKPILGICNGFQALIKAGLLEGQDAVWAERRRLTLTHNASGHFVCRWVVLEPDPGSPCVFTRHLEEPIFCPVAHGEGRLMGLDEAALDAAESEGRVCLRYAQGTNPNGSHRDIAGLCNTTGTIMGLMPHPEDHIVPEQHPGHHRGQSGGSGLALFRSGVRYAAGL